MLKSDVLDLILTASGAKAREGKVRPKTYTMIGYTVFLHGLATKQASKDTHRICPKSPTPIGYTVFLHGLQTKPALQDISMIGPKTHTVI